MKASVRLHMINTKISCAVEVPPNLVKFSDINRRADHYIKLFVRGDAKTLILIAFFSYEGSLNS